MNKVRRKTLDTAKGLIEKALELIQEVRDDEQDAYDNMPESLQDSSRGEAMIDAVYSMNELDDNLNDVISTIDELIMAQGGRYEITHQSNHQGTREASLL